MQETTQRFRAILTVLTLAFLALGVGDIQAKAASRFAAAQAKPADAAYNRGYQDGYKLGQADKRSGEKQDFTKASAFVRATDGWKDGSGGDLEAYRNNYRAGFADGYRDGITDEVKGAPTRQMPEPQMAPPTPVPTSAPPVTPAPVTTAPPTPAPAPVTNMAPTTPPVSMSVPDGTVLRMRMNSTISTRSNRQGDAFAATVSEPVYYANSSIIAIPAGATISGTVTHVQRPGRVKGTAQLNLRYDKLTMPGGSDYPMSASTFGLDDGRAGKVDETEGTVKGPTSHGRDAMTVGGGAAGGAVIGGIAGGPVGAAVGAMAGAAVGAGGVLLTRGKDVDLPSGSVVQIRLLRALDFSAAPPPARP